MSNLQIGFTTGGPDGHQHQRAVDPWGEGNTDINQNHAHLIRDGKVLPAGIDDHTHDFIEPLIKPSNF